MLHTNLQGPVAAQRAVALKGLSQAPVCIARERLVVLGDNNVQGLVPAHRCLYTVARSHHEEQVCPIRTSRGRFQAHYVPCRWPLIHRFNGDAWVLTDPLD